MNAAWSSAPAAGRETKGSDGRRDDCLRGSAEAGKFAAGTLNERRVVITGLGAVTDVGNTVPEFWKSLVEGRSGIGRRLARIEG